MVIKRKTWIKDFLTITKKNIASFLVLAVLFGAAVAMYCGGVWTCKNEKIIFQNSLANDHVALAEYSFPYGTGSADINDLTANDPDLKAEGFNTAYCFYLYNESRFQAKVMSLMEKINQFEVIEGTLPKQDGEIAVRRVWANENNLSLGDTITFSRKDSDLNQLKSESFTVTAFVETSRYPGTLIGMYGKSPNDALPIHCVMFVSNDAFNMKNGYSNIALWSASQNKADIFEDKYKEIEKNILDKIAPNAEQIYQSGYEGALLYYNLLPKEQREGIDIQDYGYFVTVKSENTTATIYEIFENIYSNVRTSLTLLFLIVSMFVGYSVISRMVHDHIQLIGMKNANGMNKKEIFLLYFAFCFLALFLGISTFGVGLSFVYELVMRNAISSIFTIAHSTVAANWLTFIEISSFLIIFVLLVVFVSVQKVMRMTVTQQLAGEVTTVSKKRFYEKFRFWKKFPLLSKTIVNNFFNDKRRVLGTVLGIIGATTLIVASFTFANLVLNSYNKQFENYYLFDAIIQYQPEDDVAANIEQTLEDNNCDYSQVFTDSFYLISDDGKKTLTHIYVYYNDESFKKLFAVKTKNNEEINDGVYLSFALEKDYGLSVGDTLKGKSFIGKETNIEIDGFFVDYLFEVMVICDIDTYEKIFETRPVPNSFVINTHGNFKKINNELLNGDSFATINNYVKSSEEAFQMIKLIMLAMKIVFLSVAIGMALIVLWNLIYVFIMEKKRDLIMLMINGYDVSFAKKYIYSDTILLVVVGLIFGTILGELFGNYTTQSFASASCRYIIGIDLPGLIYGILIVCVVMTIILYYALKRIEKFRLCDLNV